MQVQGEDKPFRRLWPWQQGGQVVQSQQPKVEGGPKPCKDEHFRHPSELLLSSAEVGAKHARHS